MRTARECPNHEATRASHPRGNATRSDVTAGQGYIGGGGESDGWHRDTPREFAREFAREDQRGPAAGA
jgi:hypothetical protein